MSHTGEILRIVRSFVPTSSRTRHRCRKACCPRPDPLVSGHRGHLSGHRSSPDWTVGGDRYRKGGTADANAAPLRRTRRQLLSRADLLPSGSPRKRRRPTLVGEPDQEYPGSRYLVVRLGVATVLTVRPVTEASSGLGTDFFGSITAWRRQPHHHRVARTANVPKTVVASYSPSRRAAGKASQYASAVTAVPVCFLPGTAPKREHSRSIPAASSDQMITYMRPLPRRRMSSFGPGTLRCRRS